MNVIKKFKYYLGGLFYLGAAGYMLATKSPEFITVTAIVLCVAFAILSITRYSDWATIGGGMLIAGSLFLQSVLSYRCIDCIRADLVILAGVITLSIVHQGSYKRTLRILSSAITVFLALTLAVHYNPQVVFGMDTVVKETKGKCPETEFEVLKPDGTETTIDALTKPVLLFSPSCGACQETIEALIKADPEGKNWIPVQSYDDPKEGEKLLKEKGYRGQSYSLVEDWPGMVPVMIATGQDGQGVQIDTMEEMLKKVRGGAN